MLLLVLAFVIGGALAAPAPQLDALNPQPGANTRFVPLVVQDPQAAPGTFVPVVVSAPAGLGQQNQPGNRSAVVFLVDNSQAEVSALLNGTKTPSETLPTVTEATEVPEEVTAEVEQTTDVAAILIEGLPQDETLASVDVIETVRQQAAIVIAADVAEVVEIAEAELKAEAQLEESVSEAVAVEKAIETADTQSVALLIQKSDGSSVNTDTFEVIATENANEAIDQAVVEQIQEAAATEQAAEVAIEEKINDIELIIKTEQKIEAAILEQVNGASVIEETVESAIRKPNVEQISNNELTGKSLLPSTSTNDEAVNVKEEKSQTPLLDALAPKAAQEHITGTITTAITEQEVSGADVEGGNTQVNETPTVLISEVVPAIGGIIGVGSGSTQEETEPALLVVSDSTSADHTNEKELIVESSSSKSPSEIVLEQQETESVSKTLDEAEQTVRSAEQIISTAGGSVTDADSTTLQEQTIVHLEPVVTVLNDVVFRGKAISDGPSDASEVLSAQTLEEGTPVSVTVEEVAASESPESTVVEVVVDSEKAEEEIIVAEVSTAAAQDVVSVADLRTTLHEVLSGQTPDTSAVVIIPQELTGSVQEEGLGTSSANQAKEISVADVAEESSSTSVSSATDDGPVEVAMGNSAPIIDVNTKTVSEAVHDDSQVLAENSDSEVKVTASEAAPAESVAVVETSAQVESAATVEIAGRVESVTAVETKEPVESVAAVETSAPVESVAAIEASAPVKSAAAEDSSSLGKSQTDADETSVVVSESVSTSPITNDVSQSIVTQSKQFPASAQQNLLVGSGGRVVFGTSTFGSSVSPANFIIGQPVRVPQRVALELAARASRTSGTDQARTIVGPRFQQFIFDNDSPDVVAAKVNFFRARAASLGAPLALSVQPMPAATAADAGPSVAA